MGFSEAEGMVVWERILDVERRKVGIDLRVDDKAIWSKRLRSLSWTRKMMQVGRGGLCFEEP